MAHRRKRNVRSEIERAHNRANLKSHIRALGLQSEDDYRAWCRKRGLGDGLHKSNRQIQKERQLARRQQGEVALTRTRQQTRSPANTIRQLYDRTLPKGRLGADYLYKIRGLFNSFPYGPTRRAFLDILLQAARRADLFRLDPVIPAFGAHPDNNFINGLAALAHHAEDWVRPVAEWVSPSHNPRKQFHHLACHLLARYDVPTFMDAAFFTSQMPEAGLHQAWFKLAVDPRSRTITQIRGRFNALPNAKNKKNLERAYQKMLLRSHNVLGQWMSREFITKRC